MSPRNLRLRIGPFNETIDLGPDVTQNGELLARRGRRSSTAKTCLGDPGQYVLESNAMIRIRGWGGVYGKYSASLEINRSIAVKLSGG